ncbi:MAG: carboxypeptidase-like regulatory domain-containing protein [Acidobacteriota bacterium]
MTGSGASTPGSTGETGRGNAGDGARTARPPGHLLLTALLLATGIIATNAIAGPVGAFPHDRPHADAGPAGATSPTATPEPPGGRIKGLVSGPDRAPIPAARIVARVRLPDHDALFVTASDDAGTYRLDRLPAGEYRVDAFAAGYGAGVFHGVDVHPPFRNILDFHLSPASGTMRRPAGPSPVESLEAAGTAPSPLPTSAVRGQVIGIDATPVADAEIVLAGRLAQEHRMVLSRQDGTFATPDLPAAEYTLSITAPGAIPMQVPSVLVSAARPLTVRVSLVSYPVELAVQDSVILPPERPLPPARWWTAPPEPRP